MLEVEEALEEALQVEVALLAEAAALAEVLQLVVLLGAALPLVEVVEDHQVAEEDLQEDYKWPNWLQPLTNSPNITGCPSPSSQANPTKTQHTSSKRPLITWKMPRSIQQIAPKDSECVSLEKPEIGIMTSSSQLNGTT